MPQNCSICSHSNRDEIDRLLIQNVPLRDIAGRFEVSKSALDRHKATHLPQTLSQAVVAAEVAHADNLLVQVRGLQDKALGILGKAEATGDLRTALQAIREARGNLELLARLLGELRDEPQTVNVLVTSPDWLQLRAAVLNALELYPDARQAVVKALSEGEKYAG